MRLAHRPLPPSKDGERGSRNLPARSRMDELERLLEPFLARRRRRAQRHRAPFYLKGLILPGRRKGVEPRAAGGTRSVHATRLLAEKDPADGQGSIGRICGGESPTPPDLPPSPLMIPAERNKRERDMSALVGRVRH